MELGHDSLQTFQRVDEGWNFSLLFEKKREKKITGLLHHTALKLVLSLNAKKTKGISQKICSLTQ